MNIINTMCKLSELSQWEIDSIVDAMPRSPYFDFDRDEKFIGFTECDAGTWAPQDEFEIVTYTEMMQRLGKTMKEFTKSDLKTGMFVKYRHGGYRMLLGNIITGDNWLDLSELRDDLLEDNTNVGRLDVMSVYITKSKSTISEYLKGEHLTLIWERIEQTPAQKEMEVLQAKMDELQEQMKVVQAKL
jgi:hypothetical protein